MEDETNGPCGVCGGPTGNGWVQTLDAAGRVLQTRCRGCDVRRRFDRYNVTRHIDTWLLTEASLLHCRATEQGQAVERLDLVRAIHDSAERLRVDVKAFERDVWFGGMQAAVRACRVHGMLAESDVPSAHGEVTVIAYAMAGRAVVTLDAPRCDITVITEQDSDEPRMGIQGINATEEEARGLLRAVADAWRRGEVAMLPDENVWP